MFESHYKRWGYITNPFKPIALHSDEEGVELMVGRGKEQKKLLNRLISNAGIVTIEGENGIGKTSLVNVVIFLMYQESLKNPDEVLYLPCIRHFQLTGSSDLNKFIDDIYYAIAQTLLKKAKEVKRIKKQLPNTQYLEAWLNSSEITSIQAQIASIGLGESRELNTSDGYLNSGFKNEIRNWLNRIFPKVDNGGIICMIDNLELLNSSKAAKAILEFLRDDLISIPGTKWIFCGSKGIIPTVASSTRLAGYLQKPIEVERLKSTYASSLLSQRIATFRATGEETPYMPVTVPDFILLYNELNGNLRDTLKKIDEYCLYIAENGREPQFDTEKNKVFQKWLRDEKIYMFESVKNFLNRDRECFIVLNKIMEQGGLLSETDILKIGYRNFEALNPIIDQLDSAGLISLPIYEKEEVEKRGEPDDFYDSVYDDNKINESRKKTNGKEIVKEYIISPKGWFILDYVREEVNGGT